jgi:hypothetical protein
MVAATALPVRQGDLGGASSFGGARSRPGSVVFGGAISNARPSSGGFAGGVISTGA